MDVKAHVFPAFQLVAELDLDAIALVGADGQRLDPLGLHTGDDGSRIEAFFVSGLFVLGLFHTNLLEVLVQHVHVAGIKIEPLVQRDLDVDRGHVVLFHRGSRRALAAARHRHRFDTRIRHEQHVLVARAILVHHVQIVIEAARALRLGILLHLLHDAVMLAFHHGGALRTALHRIFDDRLSLEPFCPGHAR